MQGKYKEVICHCCGKSGHLQKAYQSEQRDSLVKRTVYKKVQVVCQVHEKKDEEQYTDVVFQANSTRVPPILVDLTIDGHNVSMEIDTGASASLISENLFKRLWPGRSLQATEMRLCSYSKQNIPIVGCCYVNVVYKWLKFTQLPLIIVAASAPYLFGREWLNFINLNWREKLEINKVHKESLQTVLSRYPNIFAEGLGTLVRFKARMYVDPAAHPMFCRAKSVPYALRSKLKQR